MANEMRFMKTQVSGFDSLLGDGVPEKNQVIIAGAPGTGKTLLSFEIAYRAAKSGVASAFIALDENPSSVLKNIKLTFPQFTDIDKLIDSRILYLGGDNASQKISTNVEQEGYPFGSLVSDIDNIIRDNKSKLVVIDSISFIKLLLGTNVITYRRSMISIISNLRRLGVTAFFTSELHSSDRLKLEYAQEFFLADGLITLYQMNEEKGRKLTMEVIKMRGANHSRSLVPYEITSSGFKFLKP